MGGDARYWAPVATLFEETRPANLPQLINKLKHHGVRSELLKHTAEEGSWVNSLPVLAQTLVDAGLDDCWVGLEYNPYQSGNSRCDALLVGMKAGRPALCAIEIKQWSAAGWDAVDEKAHTFGARYDRVEHPYRQARRYAQFLAGYTAGFDTDSADVHAAAYLHNATEESLAPLRAAGPDEAKFTFAGKTEADRARFIAFLQSITDPVDTRPVQEQLAAAPLKQSDGVLKAAAGIFSDRTAFPLSDEQEAAVGMIYNTYQQVMDPTAPQNNAIIVIHGGPGSGKTWIAVHLLAMLARGNKQVAYATNSASLRAALRKSVSDAHHAEFAEGMITSARTYWNPTERWGDNALDMLIVDEAQRVNEFTIRTGFGNARHIQDELEAKGITQLFELKKSAKVLVLFMDEQQQTTATDHLTMDQVEATARLFGITPTVFSLTEQHRSGGSKNYEKWVEHLINGRINRNPEPDAPAHEIDATSDGEGDLDPIAWVPEQNFSVEVASSPADLEARLQAKNAEPGKTRIVAGFCWAWQPWPTPEPTTLDEIPYDIVIDGWAKRWNLRKGLQKHPSKDLWASRPLGAEEVGSVFTAQGFEFDYVGVIMGPDLRVGADGKLHTHPEESRYDKLTRGSSSNAELAERFRNQYRVLLTRGMKGVVIYSTDPATQALLTSLVPPAPQAAPMDLHRTGEAMPARDLEALHELINQLRGGYRQHLEPDRIDATGVHHEPGPQFPAPAILASLDSAQALAGDGHDYLTAMDAIRTKPISELSRNDIANYLTFIRRGERFSTGHIAAHINNGTLLALAARLAALVEQEQK